MAVSRWLDLIQPVRPDKQAPPERIRVRAGMEVDDGSRAVRVNVHYDATWDELPAGVKTKLAEMETEILGWLQTLDPI